MQLQHVNGSFDQLVVSMVEQHKQQLMSRHAMDIHQIFGDYMEHEGMSWGWEHTAVWYMHQLNARGRVKFSGSDEWMKNDYRAPAYGRHEAANVFPVAAIEKQVRLIP